MPGCFVQSQKHLEGLLPHCRVKPMMNQCEVCKFTTTPTPHPPHPTPNHPPLAVLPDETDDTSVRAVQKAVAFATPLSYHHSLYPVPVSTRTHTPPPPPPPP